LIFGNIHVHPTHIEAVGNPIIFRESSWDPVKEFKPVVAAAKADGAVVIGQLSHAGRQAPSNVDKGMNLSLFLHPWLYNTDPTLLRTCVGKQEQVP
jgi:2,4-dienoyl-CoA reductase-like NADH-dependent reductase (Old Yellow Enzyme family)